MLAMNGNDDTGDVLNFCPCILSFLYCFCFIYSNIVSAVDSQAITAIMHAFLALSCFYLSIFVSSSRAMPLPSLSPPSPKISNVISPSHCPDPSVVYHNQYYHAVRSRIGASPNNTDPPGWQCWHAAQDQVIIQRSRHLHLVYTHPEATSVIIDRSTPFNTGWGGVSVGSFQISFRPGIDTCPSAGFWAPSLKIIDGRFFLFVTGHRPDVSGEVNFLLESEDSEDPMNATAWHYRGALNHQLPGLDGEPIVLPYTGDDRAAVVTMQENGRSITGQLYYVYSHNVARDGGTQRLHLARLNYASDAIDAPHEHARSFVEYDEDRGRAITFQRTFVVDGEAPISAPLYEWEEQRCGVCGFSVNEGPTALYSPFSLSRITRNDKTTAINRFENTKPFILYSASFCATRYYSIGLLEYQGVGTGFPFLWTKHPLPVFSGSIISPDDGAVQGTRHHAFGIGHNSITTSPDLSEYWIVYHAKTELSERPDDRETRIQKFSWSPLDGRPVFGVPVGGGRLIPAPSDASCYALFCSQPTFTGRFCTSIPCTSSISNDSADSDDSSVHAAAARGIEVSQVQSIRLVGGARVGVCWYNERSVVECIDIYTSVNNVKDIRANMTSAVRIKVYPGSYPLSLSSAVTF